MLRLADINDYKLICELYKNAIDNLNAHGIFQWDEIYPNDEVIYNDIVNQQMYVLQLDNNIAAIVVLNNKQDDEYNTAVWDFDSKTAAVIHRLCVNVEYQNRGIGSKTVLLAEDLLKDKGYKSVRLDAFSQNPYSLKLYQKLGYTRTGSVYFRKGEFYLYEKWL